MCTRLCLNGDILGPGRYQVFTEGGVVQVDYNSTTLVFFFVGDVPMVHYSMVEWTLKDWMKFIGGMKDALVTDRLIAMTKFGIAALPAA